jgi:hypothetical protein
MAFLDVKVELGELPDKVVEEMREWIRDHIP